MALGSLSFLAPSGDVGKRGEGGVDARIVNHVVQYLARQSRQATGVLSSAQTPGPFARGKQILKPQGSLRAGPGFSGLRIWQYPPGKICRTLSGPDMTKALIALTCLFASATLSAAM